MTHTNPTERLSYAIKDACHCVGVGRSLLYDEIKSGKLRVFKIGSRTLIASEDLQSWLDGYKRHAA